MTSSSFTSEVFRRLPQLKERADEELWYFVGEDPGPYTIFERILVPEIERCASSDGKEALESLMQFVEEVPAVDRDLVLIGLGEWLPYSLHENAIKDAAGSLTRIAIFRAERARVVRERRTQASPLASFVRKALKRI